MGGGLLQLVNRDTLRFAMKANALCDPMGQWHDVAKAPATDPTKGSKAGRQAVIEHEGRLKACRLDALTAANDLLQPVWRNGTLLKRQSFADIRKRAQI
jgi:nicotinamide phosphoribosyltransferase